MPQPCEQQEEINEINSGVQSIRTEVSKQEGWFKTSAWVISIAVLVIGGLSGIILGKLTAIESKLTDYQVSIAEVKKDVVALQADVKKIEERHTWLDQNGVVKKAR
jgi:cytoskeletal protein RodZ